MKNDEDTGFATCVGVKRDMVDACASGNSSSSVSLVNQLVIMVCSLILFSAQHWMLPTSTNLSGLAQSGSFLHTPCGQECRCPTSVTLGAEEDVLNGIFIGTSSGAYYIYYIYYIYIYIIYYIYYI